MAPQTARPAREPPPPASPSPGTWGTEGRLAGWQNTPSSPTTAASSLYDGEGQRVAQQVTNTTSGTTTTTSYLGNLAEVNSDGTTTTTTDYLYAAGKLLAEAVTAGGTPTLTYLVTNHQGSVSEALDTNGSVTASQLYLPYGTVRYQSGSFPTSYGYTGQRADAATGLDDYGARYYDPVVGQFTSADTLLAGGLNRYGYVSGNPTSEVDPSGHEGSGVDNGCPDWKQVICTILIVVSTGISYLHTLGVKEAQNLDDPAGVETQITTGSNKFGTKDQVTADDSAIQLEDQNGKPAGKNSDDHGDNNTDENTDRPSGPPWGGVPGKGEARRSQVASRNPGVMRKGKTYGKHFTNNVQGSHASSGDAAARYRQHLETINGPADIRPVYQQRLIDLNDMAPFGSEYSPLHTAASQAPGVTVPGVYPVSPPDTVPDGVPDIPWELPEIPAFGI